MNNGADAAKSEFSKLIAQFAGQVFFSTVGFIILAIPAVILSLAAHYLSDTFVSYSVILVIIGLHYFILGVDTLMFIAYVMASVYAASRELIRYVKVL